MEQCQSKYDDINVDNRQFSEENYAALLTKEGNLILTINERKEKWEKYLEKEFNDIRTENSLEQEEDSGPYIFKKEVGDEIRQFKNGKAAGPDNIQEFMKLLDHAGINR